MTITEELENDYMRVLRGIEDTRASLEAGRPEVKTMLSDKKLNDCLERLDGYAENLYHLDERLSSIAEDDQDGDVLEKIGNLPKYSALMQLGTSVYDRLYQDYSALSQLRDRRKFLRLSILGAALIVSSALMLVYLQP